MRDWPAGASLLTNLPFWSASGAPGRRTVREHEIVLQLAFIAVVNQVHSGVDLLISLF